MERLPPAIKVDRRFEAAETADAPEELIQTSLIL
jgi:hypothetical protein